MRGKEIVGGHTYICDTCEKEISGVSLYWEKSDFSICINCLRDIVDKHLHINLDIAEDLYRQYEISKKTKIKVIRKTITEALRNKVLKKYNYRCVFCGNKNNLQMDHIIPFSKGGKTEFRNLQPLCRECNLKKGNKEKSEERSNGGEV